MSNCTAMAELGAKVCHKHGMEQVTRKKQIPKRAAATNANFPAEIYGSKTFYRNGFPSLNIPVSSVPMCYTANVKDFLKQNKNS